MSSGQSFFGCVAAAFPTRAIAGSKAVAFVWRMLFYGFRPSESFRFITPHYTLWVSPRRDSLTRAVIRRGIWEQFETRIFDALLGDGGDVVDIGANFGHYAMVASNRLGPEAKIFAFGPCPAPFAELSANIALQPFANVSVQQMALCDSTGSATFYRDGSNPGGHSLGATNPGASDGSFEVPTDTLDNFLATRTDSARRIGLIKSDCQGADFRVLRGAVGTLARHRPYMLAEFWPQGMRDCGDDPRAFVATLRTSRYRPFYLSPTQDAAVELTSAGLEFYLAAPKPEYLDLLLIPEEKLARAAQLLGPRLIMPSEKPDGAESGPPVV